MKNKICVIGVYFGKFPNYFALWLKSCACNPTIDFHLFTDCEVVDSPANVFWHKTTLAEIKNRATNILGFEASLERSYKICDYKVLYGLLFSDFVSSYDFWGHCDFDLIFGDLSCFFDAYKLYDYDRFNALGHLSLYRNTETVNNYFRLDGGRHSYREVYSSEKNCVFDEMPGMTQIFLKNNLPLFTKRIYADIASIYDRYRIIENYCLDAKPVNYPYQIFYWENGKCFRAYFVNKALYKEELQYVHFKKRPNFTVDFDVDEVNAFYITKYGFWPKQGEVTLDVIRRYNPYKGMFYEWMEKQIYKCKEFKKRGVRYINRKFFKR